MLFSPVEMFCVVQDIRMKGRRKLKFCSSFAVLFWIFLCSNFFAFSFRYSLAIGKSWTHFLLCVVWREAWMDKELIPFDLSISKLKSQIFEFFFFLEREVKEKITFLLVSCVPAHSIAFFFSTKVLEAEIPCIVIFWKIVQSLIVYGDEILYTSTRIVIPVKLNISLFARKGKIFIFAPAHTDSWHQCLRSKAITHPSIFNFFLTFFFLFLVEIGVYLADEVSVSCKFIDIFHFPFLQGVLKLELLFLVELLELYKIVIKKFWIFFNANF